MNAVAIAQILNYAFGMLATLRQMGMTTGEIDERLDAVDAGQSAISATEVRAMLDRAGAAIEEGLDMHGQGEIDDPE